MFFFFLSISCNTLGIQQGVGRHSPNSERICYSRSRITRTNGKGQQRLYHSCFQNVLDKYKRLNFTKNPEKYIKYSVQDVAEVVDKLFDMSV